MSKTLITPDNKTIQLADMDRYALIEHEDDSWEVLLKDDVSGIWFGISNGSDNEIAFATKYAFHQFGRLDVDEIDMRLIEAMKN